MSMTQEEIEALMNETTSDDSADNNSIDDILSGIDGIVESEEDEASDDMGDILNDIAEENDAKEDSETEEESIDDIIKNEETINFESIDETTTNEDEIVASEQENENTQNNDIEEIPDLTNNVEDTPIEEEIPDTDDNIEEMLEKKIDNGVFPLPSSDEHKVVNQLNQVAEDTEEKASLIFDALSFLLDENDKISTNLNNTKEFIDSQIELLNQLSSKFPNIQVLKDNLNKANEAQKTNKESIAILEDENMKIFEAMELMQYHDINRQKIERVMSVIKKLANYLNGIFVDDSQKDEVQIAKHISGDSSQSIDDEDIDSLISEFNKE